MAVPNFERAGRRSAPRRLRLLPDERLARRAESGDPRAVDAIFQRYRQDLYRFCLAMVGTPQGAETAIEAALAKARRGLAEGKRQIKLKPWLYRIARAETVDDARHRHGRGEIDDLELAQRRLLADLEQLPQRQRAVLVMRELSELDFVQIGAAFGISAGAALEAVYEARLRLRQLQEGRELRCAKMMWELSETDGRTSRRRKARAHLRSCPECRAFRDEIAARRGDLAAIPPLPLAAGGGSGLATVVAGIGNTVGAPVVAKATATVAIVAVAGLSAPERDSRIAPPPTGKSASGSPGSAPEERISLPVGGGGGPVLVAQRDVAAPPLPSFPVPGLQWREPPSTHAPPDSGASEGSDRSDGSPAPATDPGSPPGGHGQLALQPHGDADTPPAEAAHEDQPDAIVSEATVPEPQPEPEDPSEDSAESPSGGIEPPPTLPIPPSGPEPPATSPAPPEADRGWDRAPEWPRRRRPRHRF